MEPEKLYCAEFASIIEVLVIAETEKTITLMGEKRKRLKHSEFSDYFKTRKEAIEFLLNKETDKIRRLENDIASHREKLEILKKRFSVE